MRKDVKTICFSLDQILCCKVWPARYGGLKALFGDNVDRYQRSTPVRKKVGHAALNYICKLRRHFLGDVLGITLSVRA